MKKVILAFYLVLFSTGQISASCPEKLSDAGYSIIKEFEGFKGSAYSCVAKAQTIGYGHVIKRNDKHLEQASVQANRIGYPYSGLSLNNSQAAELFKLDVNDVVAAVVKQLKAQNLTYKQQHLNAYTSLFYNVGTGCIYNRSKGRPDTTIHYFNNRAKAADQFFSYCTVNRKVNSGLFKRRLVEACIFLDVKKAVDAIKIVKTALPDSLLNKRLNSIYNSKYYISLAQQHLDNYYKTTRV